MDKHDLADDDRCKKRREHFTGQAKDLPKNKTIQLTVLQRMRGRNLLTSLFEFMRSIKFTEKMKPKEWYM